MNKISFCIPWFDGGDKRRRDIFEYLYNYYATEIVPAYPNSELITGGGEGMTAGELNRSKMRNNCVRRTLGDIIFLIDADCYLSKDSIDAALERLTDDVGIVQYTRVSWVREENTKKILYEGDASFLFKGNNSDVLWGLVFVITKNNYYKAGAFNEQYLSWGEEDPAFTEAVTTLVGRLEKVPVEYPAIHLEHPRGAEHNTKSASFRRNQELRKLSIAAKGNPSAMRKLLGIPEPIIVDAHAYQEHYAEHIAPLFQEFYKRGIAGKFVMPEYFFWRIKPIFEENGFPMETIVFKNSESEASQYLRKREGSVICAGIGDARMIEATTKRPVVLIEHGAGQQYGNRALSFIGGVGREDLAMIVTPREKTTTLSQRFYPQIPHSSGGCPKLDWYTGLTGGDAICISFHWHTTVCPESDWAYEEYKSAIKELKEFCDSRHIELIGHCHPRSREHIFPYYRELGIRVVDSFYNVCKQSKMYICDNSSTIFEFAALGRPVVFLNSKFYRRSVNFGLRFWTNTDVGVMVDTPESLVDKVSAILDNGVEIDPEAIKRVYNNIGYASSIIADDIIKALKERVYRPAQIKDSDMIKMVLQREIMLKGKVLPKGTTVIVDEKEAQRLESYFLRGTAAAIRESFIDILPSEINPEFPFEKTLVAPTEKPDAQYQGLETLDTEHNDSITVIPPSAEAIANMSVDPKPKRTKGGL